MLKKNLKLLPSFACVAVLLLLMSSCAHFVPCGFDKDQYLDNFKAFMREAEDMKTDAKEAAWSAMDERFETLSEDCYEQWEDELSLIQKTKVAGWILKYQYIRLGKPLIDPDN